MTHNDGAEVLDCEFCQIEGSGWEFTVRFRTDPPKPIARACYKFALAAMNEGHFIEDRAVEDQFIHGSYKSVVMPVWEEKEKK